MGFGISDEVMEKIRDSLWYNPSDTLVAGRTSSPSAPNYRRTQSRPNPAQLYYPPVKTTVPTYTSLSESELFLASTYYAINSAISQSRLKSEIIGDRIAQLSEYYSKLFQILNLDASKIISVAKKQYDNLAKTNARCL